MLSIVINSPCSHYAYKTWVYPYGRNTTPYVDVCVCVCVCVQVYLCALVSKLERNRSDEFPPNVKNSNDPYSLATPVHTHVHMQTLSA